MLEVTPCMGEVVAVATRLGSLSLALRSFATATRDPASGVAAASSASAERAPIWASDISRAVRDLPRNKAPQAAPSDNAAPAPMPRTVTIYRGSDKIEGQSVAQSGTGTPGTPPLPSVPVLRN